MRARLKMAMLIINVLLWAACSLEGVIEAPVPEDDIPPTDKVIIVGTQSNSLYSGNGGSVSYDISTEKIDDGSYPASVSSLPAGFSVSPTIEITGDSGQLTLVCDSSVTGGTHNIRLTLNVGGETVISNNFLLEVLN